jgi:citrate synthase
MKLDKYYTGETARINLEGKDYELPIVIGEEGEKAIDISALRSQSGFITLDYGYMNTGSCASAITYLDGENSVLNYRGYPIAELAEKCIFVEVAYLLIHGCLPTTAELANFQDMMRRYALLHEDMVHFFDGFPAGSPPMSILSSMVNSLCVFYPDMVNNPMEKIDKMAARLISKVRTIAAFSYRKAMGHPLVYPRHDYSYCANFLNMMFDSPVEPYEVNPVVVNALNKLLILHGDHEQNCSTSTVRMVGSAHVNLYASISAGISALWGPLHGGANQAVVEMLQRIHRSRGDYRTFINRAKDPKDSFRLVGFGHRVYKSHDPRCTIIKNACDDVLKALNIQDPLLDIARELEEVALNDDYFNERNLYPNVDFYSGIIYKAIGIPTEMFTVMFALGRLPGWIAHWKEMRYDKNMRIGRPRQIYVGPTTRRFLPLGARRGVYNFENV